MFPVVGFLFLRIVVFFLLWKLVTFSWMIYKVQDWVMEGKGSVLRFVLYIYCGCDFHIIISVVDGMNFD